jgi:PAS domain S-box-containing protein
MDNSAVVMADQAGIIRFWSAGAEKAFGYSAAQAIGETLDLIVPAEYREAHWRGFRHAVESGAADLDGQTSPFPVRHADGAIAETPGRLTLVRRPQGQVIAAVVAFE